MNTQNLLTFPSSKPAIFPDKKIGYIPTLDGWRAIAIFLVILSHAGDQLVSFFGENVLIQHMSDNGLLGVRVFFGISGFLITSRMIEEIQLKGGLSFKGFYLRRAFRILPPLFLYCSVVGLLGLLAIIPVWFSEWLGGMFFFANMVDKHWYTGHLWSLAVEEHFYLIWPLLFCLFFIRKRLYLLIGVIVLLCIWRLIAWKYELYSSPGSFWGRTDIQLDGLLWGAVAACIYQRLTQWSFRSLFGVSNLIIFGVLLVLVSSERPTDYKIALFKYSVESALIAYVILVFSLNKAVHSMLEIYPLRWVGRISYSLYLWQQLFLVKVEDVSSGMGVFQSLPVSLACTVIMACVSYYLVERKFIRLGYKVSPPTTIAKGRE